MSKESILNEKSLENTGVPVNPESRGRSVYPMSQPMALLEKNKGLPEVPLKIRKRGRPPLKKL